MPISTNLWRAQIGTFGIMIAKLCVMNTWSSITKAKFQSSFVLSFFFLITFLSLLLILSNGVELNPGPKKDSSKRNFSIAHWNLNSIAAQNFVTLSQLEAYNIMHNYDLICLSETWLNCTTSINSNDLSLKGYNVNSVDDPDNNRSYKRDLPRKAIPGIRFGISQKQKMVKAYVLFLQTN